MRLLQISDINVQGVEVVRELLAAGAEVNMADSYQLRPLHHAAMRGNRLVVECLLSHPGIQVDARDAQASTSLHIAATYGNLGVVELLLAAGADCATLDYQDQNPLHRAAKEGNNNIAEIIIEQVREDEETLKELTLIWLKMFDSSFEIYSSGFIDHGHDIKWGPTDNNEAAGQRGRHPAAAGGPGRQQPGGQALHGEGRLGQVCGQGERNWGLSSALRLQVNSSAWFALSKKETCFN